MRVKKINHELQDRNKALVMQGARTDVKSAALDVLNKIALGNMKRDHDEYNDIDATYDERDDRQPNFALTSGKSYQTKKDDSGFLDGYDQELLGILDAQFVDD